jgi:hypothetical protein
VAPRGRYVGSTLCARRAAELLAGLGDAQLGEWREWTGAAYHLRRRLTAAEAVDVGPVRDVRRTPEARRRALALGATLRAVPAVVYREEVGD